MASKSVAREAEEIVLATRMIHLGARLQVLQAETSLSYDRLARLYREIKGCSPPKGMLPFSVDWFMTWLPNVHSTMFYSMFCYIDRHTPSKKAHALVDAYALYLEQASAGRPETAPAEPVLSFTRAWMLVRFFDSDMLQLSQCVRCKGGFVAHAHDPDHDFVCAICRPPPRAGKTRSRARPAQVLHDALDRAAALAADGTAGQPALGAGLPSAGQPRGGHLNRRI
ncbi:flagellar transcriptional regulator FlhC [Allopusillimonas soli]|uniref:Flagellar transcriptional regulator FlhC n=1 Tax=Allopusillimonas soli TaxID=659016 RepID=A0A853F7M6_9BURK|nr:flagellar transcriptional regulator FlhC [Allopusillimonas soli]NYT35542.1 flagellar transcriptional regulator FlhC [Allopusillimonas soli]TEA75947.1 flagellar transcriptional regulator FlhC [Allopusillimonas soli]